MKATLGSFDEERGDGASLVQVVDSGHPYRLGRRNRVLPSKHLYRQPTGRPLRYTTYCSGHSMKHNWVPEPDPEEPDPDGVVLGTSGLEGFGIRASESV